MNYDELRSRQTVLKQSYRDNPQTALVTLRAEGHVGRGIDCRVGVHGGDVVAGLHPATGGNGAEACSGDMLLQALVACSGVTLAAVAKAMGITITDSRITAEGELDFRGTLGVAKDAPVGFTRIRLDIAIQSDATEEQRGKLAELTERYCVVYQTLRGGVAIETSYR